MYDKTIPLRIRNRRDDRGLASYQLAKMAGISPSYLSLIENGQKLPSEEVAIRLARALDDDPEIYRAWVETADDKDLASRADRLSKMQEMRSGGSLLGRRGRSRLFLGQEEDDVLGLADNEVSAPLELRAPLSAKRELPKLIAARARESVGPSESTPLRQRTWEIPLLEEGTDPEARRRSSRESEEAIAIDPRLLTDAQDPHDLFAYRVTARTNERVKNLVLPGDVLIFAANPEGVDPSAIYAVRVASKIVLARIVYSEPMLLLMGADHYQEPLRLEVGNEAGLFRTLVGVVVAGIRAWARPRRVEARGVAPALGRSGRLEDGNIVRDCEWKENYGWRPVQKAEDMDYLDTHPGTTVQFRLLRDDRVMYVLEMGPDQWREALGSYYSGPTWRRNGYIVAITKRVDGEYTEAFQDRWADYIRPA